MKKICSTLIVIAVSAVCCASEMAPLGKSAPELSVKKWVNMSPVSLDQYKGKKAVVLFFWSIDNASIMAFRPLSDLTGKVGDKDVAWIGIANGDEKKISEFKLTSTLPFPVAVDSGSTVKKYMPSKFKHPGCAIISRDGLLVWRGAVRSMPAVLKRLLAGKLDIKEIARREEFNIKLGSAVRGKKYKEAIALIEQEQKIKFSADLVALHLQLLLESKNTDGALAMLDKAVESHPELIGPHLLRQMVLRSYFKDEKRASAAAADSIERLKKYPKVLADMLQNEMKLSQDQRSPRFIYDMSEALNVSRRTLNKREQAVMLLLYAQAMNICSFNCKAEKAAEEAEKLFTDQRDMQTAAMLKNYYKKLNELKKQLSGKK